MGDLSFLPIYLFNHLFISVWMFILELLLCILKQMSRSALKSYITHAEYHFFFLKKS